MDKPSENEVPVRLIASRNSWIEGEAVRQLHKTAELPGMLLAVGLPDLHPGRGTPVGAVFVIRDMIYPHLVGNDVGCGMGLWGTDLQARKIKRDKWAKRLAGLESPWDGDTAGWVVEQGLALDDPVEGLGTIGGGNHFAELQAVEDVTDEAVFDGLGLLSERLVLVVHSGSRWLGEALYRSHTDRLGAEALHVGTGEADAYLKKHDGLLKWAGANRALIAYRFLSLLGSEGRRIIDVVHNSIVRGEVGGIGCWLHRKGAAPSDQGPVVIPGSRGTLTYLVAPEGDLERSAYSVVHGAGRKWKRSDARERLRLRFGPDSLTRTDLGSIVICEDRDLLYEEAPQAYKHIDAVIGDLIQAGLVRVVATFRPVITYKMRSRRLSSLE